MEMTNNELDKLEHRISILRRKRLASIITSCVSFLLYEINNNTIHIIDTITGIICIVSGIVACVYNVKLIRTLNKYINTAKPNLYDLNRYEVYIEQIRQERDHEQQISQLLRENEQLKSRQAYRDENQAYDGLVNEQLLIENNDLESKVRQLESGIGQLRVEKWRYNNGVLAAG